MPQAAKSLSFRAASLGARRPVMAVVVAVCLAAAPLGCEQKAPAPAPVGPGPAAQATQAVQEAMNVTSPGMGGAKAAAGRKGGGPIATSAAQSLWRSVLGASSDAEGAVLALQQGDRGLVRGASYRVEGQASSSVQVGGQAIDLASPALRSSLQRTGEQIGKLGTDEQAQAWQTLDQLLAGAHESANHWALTSNQGTMPSSGTHALKHRIWALEQLAKLGGDGQGYGPLRSLDAMREASKGTQAMRDVP